TITQKATQNYQPTDTLMLDLTKTDETLLAEMKRKGRYNITLSQKKGVTFSHITGKEFSEKSATEQAELINEFWRLNTETTSRDGFSGHQKEYYEHFLTQLPDYAVLFFAEYEGKKIATAISTFCGDKAIYYFGASTSDPEYRNLMAPYGLQWEMIQFAKSKHCKTYDFLGIAPENEPKHAYAGISEFKWKFGGYRATYAPGSEIVLDKKWYPIYRLAKKLK
ncbi:peptidoglycan bridge formation glycyltransferase FemA/FemB family protein, partial [Candidatus Gracilibacteria bacterium]|nr:peptidoglycan bridge formation glycyltransferase FemA/FemB family protein [Candidatus Gracilibacteria bacterium]